MDRIDQLLNAVDHPEDFTADELQSMLSDPDYKESYRMLTDIRSALSPAHSPDVDKEWQKFLRSNRRPLISLNLFSRYRTAAIIAGALALGATATVIGVSHRSGENSKHVVVTTDSMPLDKISADDLDYDLQSDSITIKKIEPLIFKNIPLADMLTEIGQYYGMKTVFTSDASKKIRLYFKWDRSLSVEEVVSLLNNFNRISISFSEDTITVK